MKIVMSHADLVEAGKLIATSEMFGKINPASGYMIASLCYQEGISYLEFSEVYNWMHGCASMKADAMLAKFCDRGGKYEVVSRTAEKAEIKVDFQGTVSLFSISWEDVKNEPFTQDRNGKTKSNYATPRKRMQSLWSRAVSDAVHTVCPQACKGNYTAEEAETFVNEDEPAASAAISPAEAAKRAGASVIDVPDPEVCPDGFGSYSGMRWENIMPEMLEDALLSAHPAITDSHRAAITAVIAERATGGK
jgi:hypothetical protein